MKNFTFKLLFAVGHLLFMFNETNSQWVQTSGPTGPGGSVIQSLTANNTFLFAGTNNGIFRSSDNGDTWVSSNSGIPNSGLINSLVEKNGIIFAGTYPGVFASNDNGLSWTSADSGLNDHNVSSFLVYDSILIAGSGYSGIYRSTNNGEIWASSKSNPSIEEPVYSFAKNGSYLFAGCNNGVYKSIDGGISWFLANKGMENAFMVLALATNGTTILACTSRDIFRSINNGDSWTSIFSDSHRYFSIAIFEGHIFVGTEGNGVLHSKDNGSNWDTINAGLYPRTIYRLAIKGSYLFAGTNSFGVWKRPLSDFTSNSGLKSENNQMVPSLSLCSSRSSQSITFSINLLQAGNLTVNLFDISGRFVKKLIDNHFSIGMHKVIYRIPNSPSNLYIVKVIFNDKPISQLISFGR